MHETLEPGGIARRLLLRRAFGAGVVVLIGSRAGMAAAAEAAGDHRQLHLLADAIDREGRQHGDVVEPRRYSRTASSARR